MAGKIIVPILSAFSAKGVNDAKSALGGLKGALGEIGKAAAGAAAGAVGISSIGDFMGNAISQARDLQRNMTAVNQVFDEQAAKMKSFISTSQGMGMASSEAAQASVFVGSVLKQSGFQMDEVSAQTQRLVSLASDLAITYGYDVSEALTGMTALFRGEYDPIEKFGVAIKQAQVNALVASKGLSKLTGVEKLHAQQVARLELLYAAAADSEGAFMRQSDNLFAQQSMLTAGFNNLSASLGEPLIGPLAHAYAAIRGTFGQLGKAFMPVFETIGKLMEHLVPVIQVVADVVAELAPTFDAVFTIIDEAIQTVMPIFLGLMKLIMPVVKAVNAVLKVLMTIFKAIMIPIKVFAIILGLAIKAIGDFFDWLLGPAATQAIGGIGQAFDGLDGGIDAVNKNLDKVIANIYKVGTAVSGSGVNTNTLAGIIAASGPGKPAGTKTALTDEQKQFLASVVKFKTEMQDLLKDAMPGMLATRQLGDFEKAVVDSFQAIYDKIATGLTDKILSSSAATGLRKYAALVKTELQQIASERDKLANKLDLGKALIADTKKAVKDFASLANIMSTTGDTVTKTVSYMVGKFRVTTSETVASVANAATIIGKFKDIVTKTRDFKKNLEALKAMGISGDLYTQILGLGLDQGGSMAASILAGGQTAVDTLNGLQTEINGLGSQMGESAAQVMYGAGIDLTDGLVAGILAADEKLKAAAETLANTFKTTFDNAINGGGKTGSFTIPKVDTSYAETAIAASQSGSAPAPSNVTINVSTGVAADPYSVGKTIVQYINQYARVSGPVTFA